MAETLEKIEDLDQNVGELRSSQIQQLGAERSPGQSPVATLKMMHQRSGMSESPCWSPKYVHAGFAKVQQ
jgi:hypothetical protein